MFVTRKDIEKILETMDKFPDATRFELLQENCSGIGSITNLIVSTNVNGLDGEFKVEVSGVEDW